MIPKSRYDKIIFVSLTFFLAAVIYLFAAGLSSSKKAVDVALPFGTASPLNEGWYYFDKENGKTEITLPARIPADKNGSAKIFRKIENSDKDKKYKSDYYLDFITHHQNMKVTFGIKMLYEYKASSTSSWLKSYRTFHHFIHIPPYEVGTICIETTAVIPSTRGEFNQILEGSKSELVTSLLLDSFFDFALGLLLLVAGLAFAVYTRFYSKIETDWTIIHLTTLLIVLGIWQIEDSGILQILVGRQAVHWFFEYPFQYFILFDTFLLCRDFAKDKNSLPLKFLFAFDVILAVFQIFFQRTGRLQFTSTIFLNFLPYSLVGILILYYVNTNPEYRKKRVTYFFNASTGMIIIAFIMAFVLRKKSTAVSYFLDIAIFMTFISLSLVIYRKSADRLEGFKTSQLYRKLALIDLSTGVSSKTAWFRLSEEFNPAQHELKDCCLIMFDMNNLKKINDIHGHLAGDQVISSFCNCLVQTVGMAGEIFRVGGDEFICFCNKTSREKIDGLLKKFDSAVENQKDSPLPFTAAYGYAFFTPRDKSDFAAAQAEADKNMYSDKIAKKAQKNESC